MKPTQEKTMEYRCGKCEQEEKYPDAEPIPNHFRTCPKNTLKNAYIDEEIMKDWENQLLLSFKSMEAGLSGSQVDWILVFIQNIIHYTHEKAYQDASKRFRMREKALQDSFRRKVEGMKWGGDFAPTRVMKLLGMTKEEVTHDAEIHDRTLDDVLAKLKTNKYE